MVQTIRLEEGTRTNPSTIPYGARFVFSLRFGPALEGVVIGPRGRVSDGVPGYPVAIFGPLDAEAADASPPRRAARLIDPFLADERFFTQGYFRPAVGRRIVAPRAPIALREVNVSELEWELGNALGLAADLGYKPGEAPLELPDAHKEPVLGSVVEMITEDDRRFVGVVLPMRHSLRTPPASMYMVAMQANASPSGTIDALELGPPFLVSRQAWLHGFFRTLPDVDASNMSEASACARFWEIDEVPGDRDVYRLVNARGHRVIGTAVAHARMPADFDLLGVVARGHGLDRIRLVDQVIPW